MGGQVKLKRKAPRPAKPALALRAKVPDWPSVVLETATRQKPVTLRDCHTALSINAGAIAKAAVALDVNVIEFTRLVEATPVLFEVAYLYRELLLDDAEGTVRTAVREDPVIAMQVLQRLGKRRGYGDRDIQAPSKIVIEFVKDWRGDRSLPEADQVVEATIVEENGPPEDDPLFR